MTGTTIATNDTVGVALTADSQLPLTITTTGTIAVAGTANGGDAVYGNWGVIGAIGNSGVLTATQDAIYLSSGGTVSNSGSIKAGRNGIGFQQGGTINNAGTLAGGNDGAYIDGAGIITNTGAISGTGNAGVFLHGGGSVSNGAATDTTASIAGANTGVQFGIRGVGTLTNFGTIASLGTASGDGVFTNGQATIVNGSNPDRTALISGYLDAISIGGGAAVISNFGRILGGGTGSPAAASSIGIYLRSGGSITNGSTRAPKALIAGAEFGIEVAHGLGTVSNLGTIEQTGTLGRNGVLLNGGGTLVNGGSADLTAFIGSAGRSAVYVAGTAAGAVSNFGTIEGARNGVALATGGTVVNGSGADSTALITGATAGVYVEGNLPSSVVNYGTISCTGSGRGVFLYLGGNVTNGGVTNTSALISGGIYLDLPGTVTNDGQIRSSQNPAVFLSGGTLDNDGGITASGMTGVYLRDAPGVVINGTAASLVGGRLAVYARSTATVTNLGRISSTLYSAVDLLAGGSVTNGSTSDAKALVAGNWNGAYFDSLGSVTNYGTITGKVFSGVDLNAGGAISNLGTAAVLSGTQRSGVFVIGQATIVNQGTIIGPRGIQFTGAGKGTVVNSGTIASSSGAAGTAIQFGGGAERLVVDPGAVFVGNVIGGSGRTWLELAAGPKPGTFGGIGTQFTRFGFLDVDPGANWTLTGAQAIGTLTDNGSLMVTGSLDVSASLDPASTGTLALGNMATLEVASVLGPGPAIVFLTNDTLVVDTPGSFGENVGAANYTGPLLEGFDAGNAVDLKGVPSGLLILNYATASGVLTISDTSGPVASLLFQNASLGTGGFHTNPDGNGGTLLTHS